MTDINILLNDFATRCFRDLGDGDYICARMAYRARQIEQFHWMSLQAIEKYLKAILLYNKIKARYIGHDLSKALDKCKELKFNIDLSKNSKKLINHLDQNGQCRYLEISYHSFGITLLDLDRCVWEIRRYCQVLEYTLKHSQTGEEINTLNTKLDKIPKLKNLNYHKFRITGGRLEKILDDKNHPARDFLVWKNAFYSSISRKSITIPLHKEAKNSPLFLHPELLDHIDQYVAIPKYLLKAYQELHKNRSNSF